MEEGRGGKEEERRTIVTLLCSERVTIASKTKTIIPLERRREL